MLAAIGAAAEGAGGFGGALKTAEPAEMLRDKGADGRYPTDHFLVAAAVEW